HRLEEGGPAGAAVAGTTGGDALGLVTGAERTTGVTRLGADVGAGQVAHRALRVVDGLVLGLDGAAVPAGGGAGAAHRRADSGLGGAGHVADAAVPQVHPRPRGPAAVGPDPGHVPTREDRASHRAHGYVVVPTDAGTGP